MSGLPPPPLPRAFAVPLPIRARFIVIVLLCLWHVLVRRPQSGDRPKFDSLMHAALMCFLLWAPAALAAPLSAGNTADVVRGPSCLALLPHASPCALEFRQFV